MGLHHVEHAPGQCDTLIGVNKDIRELLGHDSVKGFRSCHKHALPTSQQCVAVLFRSVITR